MNVSRISGGLLQSSAHLCSPCKAESLVWHCSFSGWSANQPLDSVPLSPAVDGNYCTGHLSSPFFRATAALTQQGNEGLGVLGGENAQTSCLVLAVCRRGSKGKVKRLHRVRSVGIWCWMSCWVISPSSGLGQTLATVMCICISVLPHDLMHVNLPK